MPETQSRLETLLAANKARRQREGASALMRIVAPIAAAHCARFSIHLKDEVDRSTQRWISDAVPFHGPWVDCEGFPSSGCAAEELEPPLRRLFGRNGLAGWAVVLAGFDHVHGRVPAVATEASSAPALVAHLRMQLWGSFMDTWIACPERDWCVRVYHEGTIDLWRP